MGRAQMLRSPIAVVTAAIMTAGAGIGAGLTGHAAAGVVFVGLAVAIACTALRHHLRKDDRR